MPTKVKKARPLPAKFPKATKVKILRRARELMATRGGWIRGTVKQLKSSALDQTDRTPEDYAYCIHGACNQAAIELGYATSISDGLVVPLLSIEDLARRKYEKSAVFVNDHLAKDKRMVIGLIDTRLKELGG